MTMSSCPRCPTVSSTACTSTARSRTSPAIVIAPGTEPAAAVRRSGSRASIVTEVPSAASAREIARPILEEAPPTIATVPFNPMVHGRTLYDRRMHYRPIDASNPRSSGPRTFMRLPHVQTLEDVDVVVIGIPTDDAVSFKSGARFGPEGIRSASALLRPYNSNLHVDVHEVLSMVDYGDAPTVPGYHELTLTQIEEFLARFMLRRDPAVPGR